MTVRAKPLRNFGVRIYNPEIMKNLALLLLTAVVCLTACNKPTPPATASNPSTTGGAAASTAPDAVEKKLQEYAGAGATDCGRFEVKASPEQAKAASDCAMQASQNKRAFYVAYDMPGMAVGVAGNASGKLFSVQSQGEGPSATLSGGDCPAELRIAGSGRVTCFAPGDMGSMGAVIRRSRRGCRIRMLFRRGSKSSCGQTGTFRDQLICLWLDAAGRPLHMHCAPFARNPGRGVRGSIFRVCDCNHSLK